MMSEKKSHLLLRTLCNWVPFNRPSSSYFFLLRTSTTNKFSFIWSLIYIVNESFSLTLLYYFFCIIIVISLAIQQQQHQQHQRKKMKLLISISRSATSEIICIRLLKWKVKSTAKKRVISFFCSHPDIGPLCTTAIEWWKVKLFLMTLKANWIAPSSSFPYLMMNESKPIIGNLDTV